MNNKKSLFFGLIEINYTVFHVLYNILVLIVMSFATFLMLIAAQVLSKKLFNGKYLGVLMTLVLYMTVFLCCNMFTEYKPIKNKINKP